MTIEVSAPNVRDEVDDGVETGTYLRRVPSAKNGTYSRCGLRSGRTPREDSDFRDAV